MKKKLFAFVCLVALCLTGCGVTEKKIEGSLEDIMTKVYEGIPEEEKPMALSNTEVTEENIEYYIGTKDLEWKEALVSEPMVGSIAHSVVLIRMKENADIEKAKELIKEKANPRKWICVEASNVYVESKGDLIVLIMSNEMADTLKTNFQNLK